MNYLVSPKRVAEVRRLVANGTDWKSLARVQGMTYERFRAACDPAYRLELRERRKRFAVKTYSSITKSIISHEHEQPPPPFVYAERDARCSTPRSLTASICGDPPPGYSALDRRG